MQGWCSQEQINPLTGGAGPKEAAVVWKGKCSCDSWRGVWSSVSAGVLDFDLVGVCETTGLESVAQESRLC